MTLIVAKQLPRNRYAFVGDFRISYGADGSVQNDEALKFFDAGGRPGTQIGFFAAGAVAYWQRAAPLLRKVAHKVLSPKARERGGPLLQALNQAAGAHSGGGARAVVFIVEKDRDRSRVLVARVFSPRPPALPGMVAELDRFPDDGYCLIGSGSAVPGIRHAIEERVKAIGEDSAPYQVANAIRDGIRSAFDAAGDDSYEKYGVSRDMGVAVIEGGHFRHSGEEGFHVDEDGNVSVYELSRDRDSRVTLKDRVTGEAHPLTNIDQLAQPAKHNPIDVQRKADGDPTEAE